MSKHNIKQQRSGIESHNSLGVGERYRAYLRKVYLIGRADSPHAVPKVLFSIVEKIRNVTTGVNGLSPTLKLFAVIPKKPINPRELPTKIERLKSIKSVREKMSKMVTNG